MKTLRDIGAKLHAAALYRAEMVAKGHKWTMREEELVSELPKTIRREPIPERRTDSFGELRSKGCMGRPLISYKSERMRYGYVCTWDDREIHRDPDGTWKSVPA